MLKVKEETLFVGGTLIVSIPCREGLLVMADKLGKCSNGCFIEENQKLLQVDRHTLIGSTGTTTFIRNENGVLSTVFDANEAVRDALLHTQEEAIQDRLENVAETIDRHFKSLVLPEFEMPKTNDGVIFRCRIFHFSSRPEIFALEYENTNGKTPKWRELSEAELYCKPWQGNADLFVNAAAPKDINISKARDEVLSEYRRHALAKDFSFRSAVVCAAKMISIVSQNTLRTENAPVGNRVDTFLLTEKDILKPIAGGASTSNIIQEYDQIKSE